MADTLSKDELNDVFLDVRKSYRLLYLYQRRVMDLAKFIGNHYGFKYIHGWNYFANGKNPKQLNNLDFWAWDLLSMYVFTFQFSTKDFGDFKNIELLVSIVSDTGFYDVSNVREDKIIIDNFNDVENAQTQLHLCLKTNGEPWGSYRNEMYKVESPIEYTKKKDQINDFLIGKKYDLADFMNEKSTLEQLKDFEEFCKKNTIVLRPNV